MKVSLPNPCFSVSSTSLREEQDKGLGRELEQRVATFREKFWIEISSEDNLL